LALCIGKNQMCYLCSLPFQFTNILALGSVAGFEALSCQLIFDRQKKNEKSQNCKYSFLCLSKEKTRLEHAKKTDT
jgi:hypothetical protein